MLSQRVAAGLYNSELTAWGRTPPASPVFLPDSSAQGNGAACGDRVIVDYRRDGAMAVHTDSCLVCRASAGYMASRVQGRLAADTLRIVYEVLGGNVDTAFKDVALRRPDCFRLPWEVLKSAVLQSQNSSSDRAVTTFAGAANALSCDACVHSCSLSFEPVREPLVRRLTMGILRIPSRIAGRNRTAQQLFHRFSRFGKLVLSDAEIEELDAISGNISPEVVRYWYRTNVLGIVLSHVRRPLPPLLAGDGRKYDLHLTEKISELELIRRLAADLEVSVVKGGCTRELYSPVRLRSFHDIDIVVPDSNVAFELGSRLLRQGGYSTSLAQNTAFSLKVIVDDDGKQVLTGHYHLRKKGVGGDLVVDISFPGLPVGLNDSLPYYSNWDQKVRMTCVTLAHLLKHDLPRIKDLNDFYLLIGNGIDSDLLKSSLLRHNLSFRFALACCYVDKHYGADARPLASAIVHATSPRPQRFLATAIVRLGWPFRPKLHLVAQAVDQYLQLKRNYSGFAAAKRVFGMFVSRRPGHARPDRQGILKIFDTDVGKRVYMVPVLTFRSPVILRFPSSFTTLPGDASSGVCCRDGLRLMVNPVGMFILTSGWKVRNKPCEIDEVILMLLNELDLPIESVEVVRGW